MQKSNVSNEFECFQMCRRENEKCKAASYNAFSCFLYKENFNSNKELNWISYIKKPNNLTHSDPKSYKIISNLRLQNHFLMNATSDELECFKLCASTKDCKASSFSYELFKSTCFLYKTGFTSKEETKWITFIKIGKNGCVYSAVFAVNSC